MATIVSQRQSSPAGTPRIKSPSIADTPTSSTRGSLDLSSSTTPRPPQRRNRAALRDYYNLKKPQESLSRTASIGSVASDSTLASVEPNSTTSVTTAQLDKQDFNEHAYISQLLSTSNLREILKVEATLVSEIRNLDGERKALVYDNYSKLIKAVATIGEMQRGMHDEKGGLKEIEGLEAKMEALRSDVVDLTGQREVNGDERRQKKMQRKAQEENVAVVRRVLKAPETLQELVGAGKLDDAEREWRIIQTCFQRLKNAKGVSELQQKCEEIMREDDSSLASDG